MTTTFSEYLKAKLLNRKAPQSALERLRDLEAMAIAVVESRGFMPDKVDGGYGPWSDGIMVGATELECMHRYLAQAGKISSSWNPSGRSGRR